MNREDVIRMAQEAGMAGMLTDVVTTLDELQKFAALVAAHEREECATEIQSEINDEIEDEAYCILVALLARVRTRGQA